MRRGRVSNFRGLLLCENKLMNRCRGFRVAAACAVAVLRPHGCSLGVRIGTSEGLRIGFYLPKHRVLTARERAYGSIWNCIKSSILRSRVPITLKAFNG